MTWWLRVKSAKLMRGVKFMTFEGMCFYIIQIARTDFQKTRVAVYGEVVFRAPVGHAQRRPNIKCSYQYQYLRSQKEPQQANWFDQPATVPFHVIGLVKAPLWDVSSPWAENHHLALRSHNLKMPEYFWQCSVLDRLWYEFCFGHTPTHRKPVQRIPFRSQGWVCHCFLWAVIKGRFAPPHTNYCWNDKHRGLLGAGNQHLTICCGVFKYLYLFAEQRDWYT